MKLSQKLYESSLITYMRTDSPSIADDAMASIKTQIVKIFGEKYYKRTVYKTKNTSAQQSHECIRPTNFTTENVLNYDGLTQQHDRLYKLILRRTLGSQMEPATIEVRTIKIVIGEKKKDQLIFTGNASIKSAFLYSPCGSAIDIHSTLSLNGTPNGFYAYRIITEDNKILNGGLLLHR